MQDDIKFKFPEGHCVRYKDQKPKEETKSLNHSQILNDKKRFTAWTLITSCPKCGGCELFYYHDIDQNLFYIRCETVPNSIYKELDCLCKEIRYEPSARSRSKDGSPVSHSVDSTDQYVEEIQPKLCSWNIVI